MVETVMPGLERRLKAERVGDVLFDRFSRGRYATDASHYQIMPLGVVGNNSCGARSLRYGNTRENVIAVDAMLADGGQAHFGPMAPDLSDIPEGSPLKALARDLLAIGAREATEVSERFPKVQRRVG